MRFSMILGSALLLAGLTAACQPIQPEAPAVAEPMGTVPMLPEVMTAPTTASTIFVLPDGTTCTFAGTGATLAFDGERLNYNCTNPATPLFGILGDPVQDVNSGAGVWTVTLATISRGADGFVLDSSETITFFAAQIELENGSLCLHAGFGATLGFDDKRLNYTCGQVDGKERGIVGELVYDATAAPGVYVAQQVVFHSAGDAGWALDASEIVDALTIVGAEMPVLPGQP